MLNIYGDKYHFIEADYLRDLQEKIDSKASDGYELVTMMSDGSSVWGKHYVAAMTKVTPQRDTGEER